MPSTRGLHRGLSALRQGRALVAMIAAERRRRQTRRDAQGRLSPRLRTFVEQLPEERESLVAFVTEVAGNLPASARILDAGAGDAPYSELFSHCDYLTADWENSPHEQARRADLRGSLDALPVTSSSFDAVLCTQVLEHVAEPAAVLRELHRVIRPGGKLYLTVPLVGELHEEPYDFYRYTPHGLRHLLGEAGFTVDSVQPRTGCFTTLAGMARAATWAAGPVSAEHAKRMAVNRLLLFLAAILPAFDELDQRLILPLGYACVATRPEA